MFIYHDTHSDFKFPWSYLIACKSNDCAQEWNRNEAEINLRMHERILPSKSGKPMLKHFDGATMQSYMRPFKTWETMHCRQEPKPEECVIFDESRYAAVSWNDAFELVPVEGEGETGHILVAKMDLTAGTVIYDAAGSTLWHGLSFMHNQQRVQIPVDTDTPSSSSTRPTCSVTRKLSNLDLTGKINPLQDRQSHLFEMNVVSKDVLNGEKFPC
jgi:hypothetical protein